MIVHDLQALTTTITPVKVHEAIETENILFHALLQKPHFCPSHRSPFGLAVSVTGRSSLRVNRKLHHIDAGHFFVVNKGAQLGIEMDTPSTKETLLLFFKKKQLMHIANTYTIEQSKLIDDPTASNNYEELFIERIYPQDNQTTQLFGMLKQLNNQNILETDLQIDNLVYAILDYLFLLNKLVGSEIDTLKYSKASTRRELYKRLHAARDFMDSSYSQKLTLDDIADVACINTYYFLRLFKEHFHQTPHAHLTAIRLQHAADLLANTDSSVTDICNTVGFESSGSFSNLFKQYYGVPPTKYRIKQ